MDRKEAITQAAQYGRILVQQAILINSGALLAFPVYLAAIGVDRDNLALDVILFAAGLFLAGLLTAAFSAYSAYLNFTAWACLGEKSESKARLINWTTLLGNVFGLLSYVFFLIGCYFAALAFIGSQS